MRLWTGFLGGWDGCKLCWPVLRALLYVLLERMVANAWWVTPFGGCQTPLHVPVWRGWWWLSCHLLRQQQRQLPLPLQQHRQQLPLLRRCRPPGQLQPSPPLEQDPLPL